MPIYEYLCGNCQGAHEIIHGMNVAARTICPDCGEPQLKKIISAPAFRFKGNGWYETDFKTGAKRNLAGGEDRKVKKSACQLLYGADVYCVRRSSHPPTGRISTGWVV